MKSTSATTSIGGRAETRASKGITLRRVWTDTPIGRIHARVGGEALDGPPVVLVHGMVISSRYMVPTALELAPLCPVYAVDLPGYGDSVKPHAILGLAELADALAAWMDAMRFPAAHLVANSFGCQVLAEFALRHGHRVDRLVFQGPTVDPTARSVRQQLIRLIQNSSSEAPGLAWITIVDYGKERDAENPRDDPNGHRGPHRRQAPWDRRPHAGRAGR